MNPIQDTISELEAVTAELAETQDLAGKRLGDLLEERGLLIRRLVASNFDAGDKRFASIVANADHLQERLHRYADSVRGDLSNVKAAGVLMAAVRFTLAPPEPKGLDIRA